ncbi:hypothetical protein IWQ60_011475 [Tieghemiomyces parasiticus]|uniref:Saccharopine dehydrogenase NADP binding domain-containing protein n=1 Tax=Tieghemiomyces parasiticus TaxID=78921 RepID=A0A9W7ZH34_9FUNG|nr:hypothetical protein IWQ60_011475 [Tieghemiomyces parasiticus]
MNNVVWGATGFTGQYVAEYLLSEGPKDLRLALAGRNQGKLEGVRQELAANHPQAGKLTIITADSADDERLAAMVRQTRVVISTVGPYIQYGEPLIRACATYSTDYVDITGEITWVKAMARKYHAQAVRNGALIVSCCGFDSIPSDLGVYMVVDYLKQRYGRDAQLVKGSMVRLKGAFSGGTIATAVETIANGAKFQKAQRAEEDAGRGTSGLPIRYDEDFGKWQGFFFMAPTNTGVVRESNKALGYGPKFHYEETLSFPSAWKAFLSTAGLTLFYAMIAFSPTRWLMLKFLPAPGEGPNPEEIKRGYFTHHLIGEAADPSSVPNADSTKASAQAVRAYAEVEGTSDPGYGETIRYVSEAALCLALQRDQTNVPGGVLTPAAAMGEALLKRYRSKGMRFEVGSEPFIKSKI